MEKQPPNIDSRLRHILRMPQEIYQASGIIVNGRRLKSFVFTTDLAIIRNCDADAVFAVYPFTPQQAISDAIIKYSYVPVFCGVGGGTTRGLRTVQLADTGITPGAGVGNARAALNEHTLGVPVIAIGVPTVVDGATLAHEIAGQLGGPTCEALEDLSRPVMITTRDIDREVADISRMIGYAVNMALHPHLTVSDIDLYLS